MCVVWAMTAWVAAAAMATDNWDGVGDWTLDAATNWTSDWGPAHNGAPPPSGDQHINLRSGMVSIDDEAVMTAYLYLGHNFDGNAADITLNMSGGTLNTGLDTNFVGHNSANMTWNLSGGTVDVLRNLYMLLGNDDDTSHSSAILNMTGGALTIGGNFLFADEAPVRTSAPVTRTAHVQLDGGTLSAAGISSGAAAGGTAIGSPAGGGTLSMDMTGGTLILDHRVSSMGFVTAYGGTGSFVYDYDGAVPGKTVITATADPPPPPPTVVIPEPRMLDISVGAPTTLTTPQTTTNINTDSVAASRTGHVAVFYPQGPLERRKMRISTDGGLTWAPGMNAPPHHGGAQEVGLRDGGVIKLRSDSVPVPGQPGWYDVETFRFTDDFMGWQQETDKMYMPDHMDSLDVREPGLSKGPIIQIPNGDLLMPMYGGLTGDSPDIHRAYLARSTDEGMNWSFYSSIAYEAVDPDPQLPGQ
jgi:hypothetical protein